jgi:hypothetical protein
MKKEQSPIEKIRKGLMLIWKSWIILLVWALFILLFVQTFGIVIHEAGHYAAGKFYGCEDLGIGIAKFSYHDSFSNVTGWDTCPFPLVMNEDGSRVCNYQTNIVGFAGLFLSLIVLIPLLIFSNNLLRKKANRFYLRKSHLILMIIFISVMAIKSASFDLFKIGECLFNTQTGEIIFRLVGLLPTLMIIPIAALFLYDLYKIIMIIDSNKTLKRRLHK